MMNEGRLKVKARRFLALMLCVIVTFGPICRCAFADDYESGGGGSHDFGGSYPSWGTVWYGPSSTSNLAGTTYYQYGVVAYTKYDAAFYNLNIDESIYGELTNSKKVKIIASDNAFKDFADTFKVGKPDLDPSLIFNTDYAVISAWKSACDLYGETYCYSSMYTLAQKQAARDYVIGILGEDDSGGDSGGGGVGTGGLETGVNPDSFTFTMDDYIDTYEVNRLNASSSYKGAYKPKSGDNEFVDAEFHVTKNNSTVNSFFANNIGTGKYITVILWHNTSIYEGQSMTMNIYLSKEEPTVTNNKISLVGYKDLQVTTSNVQTNGTNNLSIVSTGTPLSNWVSSGTDKFDMGTRPCYMIGSWVEGSGGGSGGGDGGGDGGGGGGDDPIEPPVTWPDPPKSPTVDPPVVPTPPEPDPPEPPDPTPPDPPTPWVPIPGPDDDPITGEDFQDLLDALAEHCQHIRDSMSDNFEQLWTNQSDLLVTEFQSTRDTLVDNMQWLGTDVIAKGFTDLSSYLNELFEWLAEQLEFNVNVENNPYDDTSVVYWLKRIWSKLGSGDITTRPTDPNIDNNGWWEWLSGLLGGLVGALADIGLDKLGGLVDALDTLKDKFPFCIPWDVAALLALLVSEPVAPVVSVPMFALTATDGVQQVGSMTIDLDTYSTAWEAVRWIERIGFCVYLAMRSKDFLDLLGKIKG